MNSRSLASLPSAPQTLLSQYFGLEEKDVPAYVIHEAEADKKYVKENAAADDVGAFITAFTAGELKQRIKSEAEPEDNSGPVLVLTANNWAKNVVAGKTCARRGGPPTDRFLSPRVSFFFVHCAVACDQ